MHHPARGGKKKNIKTLNIIRPVQILDLNFVSKKKLSAVLNLQGTSQLSCLPKVGQNDTFCAFWLLNHSAVFGRCVH